MLDVDRRDRPVEGGGEERLAVVVGGVQEHVALEAEVTVPARHEFAGEPLHAHVALRGGFGLLRGSLGVAHIHLQAGQESPGGVDGRQQEVLVAPAVWAADGSGQSQQEREGDAQHGRARGSSGLMVVSLSLSLVILLLLPSSSSSICSISSACVLCFCLCAHGE